MSRGSTLGYVHSIQTLGTLDGPGVRFVLFLQGCHLRCGCCHNPDTWERSGGTPYTPNEILEKVENYRSYFGEKGGITVSGGEPLLQAEFVTELFTLCKERGINTCLDTSGSIPVSEVTTLLSVTDRVLLDVKYASDEEYKSYVGCPIALPLAFLAHLNKKRIPVTLRTVLIPSKNDDARTARFLRSLRETYASIDTVELLPFRKICSTKYESLGIPFRFMDLDEASIDDVQAMYARIEMVEE